jgi:2-iminobutanoate/2-iminopropanoate deaminase
MTKKFVGYGVDAVSLAPVSPGIEVDGWLFVSGQVALDPAAGKLQLGTIQEETHLVLQNIGKILAQGGCGFEDVVRTTIHIGTLDDFAGMNEVYREYFTGVLPTRTTVQSGLFGGCKVEIDAIARIPR